MARLCSICPHPKRKEIEGAYLARWSVSAIARDHGVTRDSIRRHVKAHLSERIVAAAKKKEIAAGSELLDRLLELNKVARAILADAYKAGERDTALRAIARLESQLELEARLIGEIKDRQINVQNVIVDPETAERMARMFLARRGFPEAQITGAETIEMKAVGSDGAHDEPVDAEDL